MLSNIIAQVAANFQEAWPKYGQSGTVPFFFGPKYETIQTAPPQIVAILMKEKFVGPEQQQMWPYVIQTWQPNVSTGYRQMVRPTLSQPAAQGYIFISSVAGTGITGSTEPTWPTTLGSTVVNGTVTWQNIGTTQPIVPRELNLCWSTVQFIIWGNPSDLVAWTPNTLQPQGSFICPTVNNQNGFYYSATQAFEGFTNVSEPLWPEFVGETVIDGTTTWTNMGIVDNFRIHDWDQADVMRNVLNEAIYATTLGSHQIVDGSWYNKTGQLIMDGFTYKMYVDFKVPMTAVSESVTNINSATLTPQLL